MQNRNKSPNAIGSIRNLKMAMDLIKNSREDLKNDDEVRAQRYHIHLHNIEMELFELLKALEMLDYPEAR